MKKICLIGQRFGRLTVIADINDATRARKNAELRYWGQI